MAISECQNTIDENGRELIKHGTTLFPIACYHDDLNKQEVSYHLHDELEFLFVTEGRMKVYVNSANFIMQKNDVLLINSGVLHGMWSDCKDACRIHSLVFHPRLVGGSIDSIFYQTYIKSITENQDFKYWLLNDNSDLEKNIRQNIETGWKACNQEKPGYELMVRNYLSNVIFQLSVHLKSTLKRLSAREIRNNDRIKQMIQYIQKFYYEDISLVDICAAAAISCTECMRCFKTTINTSPIQYLRQYRLQKAVDLLLNTDMKIIDIAGACGFSDTSYFIKCFKESKKMTPTQFLAQNQKLK